MQSTSEILIFLVVFHKIVFQRFFQVSETAYGISGKSPDDAVDIRVVRGYHQAVVFSVALDDFQFFLIAVFRYKAVIVGFRVETDAIVLLRSVPQIVCHKVRTIFPSLIMAILSQVASTSEKI